MVRLLNKKGDKMWDEEPTETTWILPSFGIVQLRRVWDAQARIVSGVPTKSDIKLVAELIVVVFGRVDLL